MMGYTVTSQKIPRRRLLSTYAWNVVYTVLPPANAVGNMDFATLASNI
jgi:hypothetical protein